MTEQVTTNIVGDPRTRTDIYFNARCPYCSTGQRIRLDNNSELQTILCDTTDVAGCDEYFAVRIKATWADIEYFAITKEMGETPNVSQGKKD